MQNRNNDPKYIGQKYGRLTVVGFEKKTGKSRGWNWIVKCDCGNKKVVSAQDVKAGKTKSCGCYHDECIAKRARKFEHGVYENRRLYRIYNGVKRRCYTKTEARYKDYGGRGITMCDEWLNEDCGFDKFVEWAISNGYGDDLTLERKDVNGNYSPENCEWITLSDQTKNKRETLWVDYHGEHIRLIELCKREGVLYDTVHDRIYRRKWTVERAVDQKVNHDVSLMRKCKDLGLNYGTVRDRIVRLGWTEERALNTPTAGRGANAGTYGFSFGEAVCPICGKRFIKNSGKQIYCGAECRRLSKSRRNT